MKVKSLIMAAAFIFSVCSGVFAAVVDEYNVDLENNILHISGTPEGCKKNDIITFALDKETERITFLQLNAGENGGYSLDIDMSGMKTDEYTVKLRVNGKVYSAPVHYSDSTDRIIVVEEILKLKTPTGLSKYLDTENPESFPVKTLDLDYEFIKNADSVRLSKILIGLIGDAEELSFEECRKLITDAATVARICEGTLDIYDYREKFGYNEKYTEIYEEKLTDNEKTGFTESYIKGKKLLNAEEVSGAFREGVILCIVNSADSGKDFEYVFEVFADELDFDKDLYRKLSSGYKNKLYEALADENFADLEAIAKKIDSEAKALIKSSAQSKPSSGGSGGGGGGRNAPSRNDSAEIYVPAETEAPALGDISPEKGFSDIKGYEWAEEAINKLMTENIISGTGDGRFMPGNNVSREELAKMIILAMEKLGYEFKESEDICFEDVAQDAWYYDAVRKAYFSGVVKGQSEKYYGSGKNVTRQDAAVMIKRAADLLGKEMKKKKEVSFTDEAEISVYASEAVKTMAEAEIINGMEDDSFFPEGFCLRAQAAKLIYGALLSE